MSVEYFFRFANPWLVFVGLVAVMIFGIIRYFFTKPVILNYSLTSSLKKEGYELNRLFEHVPYIIRLLTLIVLALLLGQPQFVNVKSKRHVDGIDIMMVLDVSGSMQCFDDLRDRRKRFEVAKEEAIRFIKKRDDDQIGLVLFGKDVISRCPLTLDKNILQEILEKLELGTIDPDGTVLCMAISMAAKRLKDSKAKSKIMIVLTDGEPTPGLDVKPEIAIALAKKLGIKIYTIGVGGEHGGLWHDPIFGIRQMGFKLNKELLNALAHHTDGNFFLAQKPDDMKKIYDTIDSLEKSEYEVPIFTHYTELVIPFIIFALMLFFLELILTSFVWFRL